MNAQKYAFFASPKPRIFGHRGASGVAPENTFASFEAASKATNYIETDVWLTKDNVPVFLHDKNLLRTCGADVMINEINFDELNQFDAGFTYSPNKKDYPFREQGLQVPGVEEIFKAFPNHYFNIEIKDSKAIATAQLLKAAKASNALDRILIAAENDKIMANIRKELPNSIPTSACYGEVFSFLQNLLAGKLNEYKCAAQAFQIPDRYENYNLADQKIIDALHSMGIEVHYWTINDPSHMKELVANGADGIVTDFPMLGRDSLL